MKTLLVTGGAGFMGSDFVRKMHEKHEDWHIIVLDALTYAGNPDNIPQAIKESPRFEFWYGDVNDLHLVNELVSRSDYIVHYAAETHVSRSLYNDRVFFQTDVLGTQSVVSAVYRWAGRVERFIHISTSEVYGSAITDPMNEDHPLLPTTPYAAAKTGADRLVWSYLVSYGIPGVIIRPFNNYGPYQHLEKLVPRLITSALMDEPLTIFGTGEASRDWLFVEDTTRGVEAALLAPSSRVVGQVINLGTGRATSVREMASAVLRILGKSEECLAHMTERPGDVQRHIAGIGKARELLDWEPEVRLEDGLARTVQWYKENEYWWRPQLWMRSVKIRLPDGSVAYY
ncbi:MAG: dTDP-glucose 4,6-dehydratase [candidate division WOR-3 bacterium]